MAEGTPRTPSTIQSDLFCSCGYNLYSQKVVIDERLDIPVTRCPECGRWHAMNTLLPTQAPWVARLALLMTTVYAIVVLWCAGMASIGLGLMQYGYVAICYESERTIASPYFARWDRVEQLMMLWLPELIGALCVLCGVIYMTLATTFFWHWPRIRYTYLLIVAVLAGGIAHWIALEDRDRAYLHPDAILRTATAIACVGAGMIAGIFVGRKITRGLLRLFLPGRARQSLAFLWLVDGLRVPMPSMPGEAASTTPHVPARIEP